jgi:serine/threonine protein kinase
MPSQTKKIKDQYEIVAEIGAGGMATVYKAIQKSLDRPVAIKELKKAFHGDEQLVQRFERESKVAASLQHENIVQIYDYCKKPAYYLVMEYVDGTTLDDVIERTGPVPIDVGIMIAIQVCNALDYAHMHGLIHRDIKPGNMMIRRNGEIKLMDFGIAYVRSLDNLTIPGTLLGTPAYMSPEQVLGQQLDVRSDLFSFGIVLYEMFTGEKPFADDEGEPVGANIVKASYVPPRRLNKAIPRSLQRVIRKCLRKKQRRRYGSMLQVEKALGKRLRGKTTKAASRQRIADYLASRNLFEADTADKTVTIAVNPPRRRSSRKWLLAVAVLLLLLT